jgi:hypothetical protein
MAALGLKSIKLAPLVVLNVTAGTGWRRRRQIPQTLEISTGDAQRTRRIPGGVGCVANVPQINLMPILSPL